MILIFPIIGAATAALLRIPLPRSWPARLAFAFLLGLGMNGIAPIIVMPGIAVIILVWRWRRLELLDDSKTRGLGDFLFAIPLAVFLCAAAVTPIRDYDGRVTWLPKARAIAHERSVTGPFFQGQRGLNLHNHYPLLMPINAATMMRISGDTTNEAARWLYVFTALAMLIAIHYAAGAWIAAAVAWLPVMTAIEGGALAAYNDLALAAFFGAAILYLMANEPRAAGLFAAFAVLTKNEGAVLAIAIIVAALVCGAGVSPAVTPATSPAPSGRRRYGRRGAGPTITSIAWIAVPPIAAYALLTGWRMLVPAAYDERYEVLIRDLPLHRLPAAAGALLKHAIDFHEWGVFWIAVVIAICIQRKITIPLIAMLAALAAYVIAFTVTSWNIADLAPVAANRLLSHLLIPAACIVAQSSGAAASSVTSTPRRGLRTSSPVQFGQRD